MLSRDYSTREARGDMVQREPHAPPRVANVRALAFVYLATLLVIPLALIVATGFRGGPLALVAAVTQPVAISALWLSFWTAAIMAGINAVMGTLAAFVLVRYTFRGKGLLNAVVDLPFAIPTLVTGVMLVVLYGPQQALGSWLEQAGLPIIYAPPGIILALLFITFPFVVRTVQPVLLGLEREQEDAAATIGAAAWETFRRVVLPAIAPALVSGTLLSFARAIGEFGAIVVVAGNIPFQSQTAAVYVFGQIESENQRGASAVSVIMLLVAFGLAILADILQQKQVQQA